MCLFHFCTCFDQPSAHHQENRCINTSSGIYHCVGGRLVCMSDLHTRRPTHSLTRRRYNPCRVLADSRSHLQPSLSLVLALHFLTPNFSASFVTPTIHLRFGLPARLLPSCLSKVFFLHGRLSCIRITCPARLSLVILIVVTRSAS